MIDIVRRCLIIFAAMAFLCAPLPVVAEPLPLAAPAPNLLITEVLPGAANASQEFIELYNPTTSIVDFAASTWQLQITSSSATSWSGPFRKVTLTGRINPGEYYLVTSKYTEGGQPHVYLTDPAADHFSSGISASAGHIRLAYAPEISTTPASWQTIDEVEWSGSGANSQPLSPSWDGRAMLPLTQDVPLGSSLKRHVSLSGLFADTNDDSQDISITACPTPVIVNTPPDPSLLQASPVPTVPNDDDLFCEADHPAPPVDDPPPVQPPPTQPPTDSPPATIIDDGSGAPASTASASKTVRAVFPAADIGLTSPQITELLANPASPQTDASDEFIELYNSNDVPFDLSGFVLQTGLTTKHKFTFAAGTSLGSHSFKAFFSAETGLSLSNSGGQVQLLDPYGNIIGQTEQYAPAKDGQAWALAAGKWFWTTTPSPNANNVINLPAASKKKTATSTTTTKKTGVKGASTSQTAARSTATNNTAPPPAVRPVQPGVLAAAAAFALLYGAYEYRHDLANKLYQLRRNRTARAEARRSAEGG